MKGWKDGKDRQFSVPALRRGSCTDKIKYGGKNNNIEKSGF